LSENQHDKRVLRCRRLGHDVTFHYCRTQEGCTPCPNILDCWWEVFDVVAFLAQVMEARELEALIERRPRPKVVTLVELIEQARSRSKAAPEARTDSEGVDNE